MKKSRLARALPLAFAALGLLITTPVRADVEGRWKLNGNGACYFDLDDDGPNQCDPSTTPQPGRWKDDGMGGCYFDSTDNGPNQCNPSSH